MKTHINFKGNNLQNDLLNIYKFFPQNPFLKKYIFFNKIITFFDPITLVCYHFAAYNTFKGFSQVSGKLIFKFKFKLLL